MVGCFMRWCSTVGAATRWLSVGGVSGQVGGGWWRLVLTSVAVSVEGAEDSRGGDVGGGDKGEGGGCGVVKVTGRRWWRYSAAVGRQPE
ncbi:hypothetical protein Tco_0045252 [Tanacetum coccineum]